MKFKHDIPVSKEKNSADQQGSDNSIPKMVKLITTVSSPKSKKTTQLSLCKRRKRLLKQKGLNKRHR